MIIPDDEFAEKCLKAIGYYRLSAYWLPFEEAPLGGKTRSKIFVQGTHFDQVIARYKFDRDLKRLIAEATERIEVHLRSRWTYHLTHHAGSHAYIDPVNFTDPQVHATLLRDVDECLARSDEKFIAHYLLKYTTPTRPPTWAVCELITFGKLSRWITTTKEAKIKTTIASELGLPNKELLGGVVQALAYVRNICAHHGRLWNKRLTKRVPIINRIKPSMVEVIWNGKKTSDNHIYNLLVVLIYLIEHQGKDKHFKFRMIELMNTVGQAEHEAMRFPNNWKALPIWQLSPDAPQSGQSQLDEIPTMNAYRRRPRVVHYYRGCQTRKYWRRRH